MKIFYEESFCKKNFNYLEYHDCGVLKESKISHE